MTAAQHSARIVLPRSGLFHSMQTSGWGRARRKSPCRMGAEQRRVRQRTFSRAASRKPRGFGEAPLWNAKRHGARPNRDMRQSATNRSGNLCRRETLRECPEMQGSDFEEQQGRKNAARS